MKINSFSDAVCLPIVRRLDQLSFGCRVFRMALFASTPFIGPGQNNFSHIF